jgi:hypothetical protein
VQITNSLQADKSGTNGQPSWREVERQLVDFFRGHGVEIKHDGGESYIETFVNYDDGPLTILILLSDLARALAGTAGVS